MTNNENDWEENPLICLTCHLADAVSGYALCGACLDRVRPRVEAGDMELAVEEASRIIAKGTQQ